ncbi:MAG: polymorphic toxin-type HINT domain-containing protein [Faecousia sp.]
MAGTAVLTATGTAAIEDIRAGDYVWAWDEETGDVALKKVVETYINETDELVHIHVNGEEIVCTPGHPFYSPVKGWTEAVNLRAGDILVLVNGEYVVVEKVQHELLESPVKVYNFQVADYHTYYVANGVLVHNDCPQRLVAGEKTGWNARVSDGGQGDHAPPHAHIFFKNEKIASVDINGNISRGLAKLGRKGLAFVNENMEQILEGIKRWWGDK